MIKWKNDRPDGWTTPFEEEGDILDTYSARRKIDYEAGATDLLELLRASGTKTDSFRTNSHPISISNPQQKGHFVFIPKGKR